MNGYYPDEFMELITIEDRDEFAIVSEEIKKFFKIREANEQNIAKITKKLLSKGFNYAIIKCAIERSVNCEIN
jgi:SOS response regulatory protein OraA/RecX